MGVIRHWRNSVLGASGVALLLPVGLAIGVGATAALGGGTTLRALGQVFAGPAVPPRHVASGLDSTRDVPSVPASRSAAAAVAAAGAASTAGSGAAPAPGATSGGGQSGGGSSDGGSTGGGSPGGGGHGGGSGPGAGGGAGPGGESATPVHAAAQNVADMATGVPVAGTTAGGAMQTVVDLIP
jgi:hypothetical protein